MSILYKDPEGVISPISAKSSVGIATPEEVGIVKPDNQTIFVNGEGIIRTKVWAGTLAEYSQVKDVLNNDTTIIITDADEIPTDDVIVNGVKIVSFRDGTDEEIAAMLAGHDAGKINIYDYWTIGNGRYVDVDALPSGWDNGNGKGFEADKVLIQLLDTSYGNNDIHFLFGLAVNGIQTRYCDYMNATDTNAGGWRDCARRYWCNNILYNGIDSGFRSLMKQFDVITAVYETSTDTTSDYLALPACTELWKNISKDEDRRKDTIYPIEKTVLKRIKAFGMKPNDLLQPDHMWMFAWFRSPVPNSDTDFGRNSTVRYQYRAGCNDWPIIPIGCI